MHMLNLVGKFLEATRDDDDDDDDDEQFLWYD